MLYMATTHFYLNTLYPYSSTTEVVAVVVEVVAIAKYSLVLPEKKENIVFCNCVEIVASMLRNEQVAEVYGNASFSRNSRFFMVIGMIFHLYLDLGFDSFVYCRSYVAI